MILDRHEAKALSWAIGPLHCLAPPGSAPIKVTLRSDRVELWVYARGGIGVVDTAATGAAEFHENLVGFRQAYNLPEP